MDWQVSSALMVYVDLQEYAAVVVVSLLLVVWVAVSLKV